jgi:hypothetical protein
MPSSCKSILLFLGQADHGPSGEFHVYLFVPPLYVKSFALPIFVFAAQPKEFFLDGLKRIEQPRHKCVELKGEYVNTFFQSRSLLFSL